MELVELWLPRVILDNSPVLRQRPEIKGPRHERIDDERRLRRCWRELFEVAEEQQMAGSQLIWPVLLATLGDDGQHITDRLPRWRNICADAHQLANAKGDRAS